MGEPIKTQPNPSGNGRPVITDEQYRLWLDDMAPFLKAGNTLWYAIERSNLQTHAFSIYEKYRSGDWFSQKVDAYRRTMGELVNNTIYTLVTQITEKIKNGQTATGLTREELDVLKFVAEKHRTAQPFFVTRTENAEVDPDKVGKILDTMEVSDYDELGQQAKEQVVADDAPVQNQG